MTAAGAGGDDAAVPTVAACASKAAASGATVETSALASDVAEKMMAAGASHNASGAAGMKEPQAELKANSKHGGFIRGAEYARTLPRRHLPKVLFGGGRGMSGGRRASLQSAMEKPEEFPCQFVESVSQSFR